MSEFATLNSKAAGGSIMEQTATKEGELLQNSNLKDGATYTPDENSPINSMRNEMKPPAMRYCGDRTNNISPP